MAKAKVDSPGISAGCGIVNNLSSNSAKSLLDALERNRDWVKTYVLPLEERDRQIHSYIEWLYDRLKDHIPAAASPDELDRLIRREVRSLSMANRQTGRKCLIRH